MSAEETKSRDFIREIIDEDNQTGKHDGRVHTRFPPEPNGYLHIGHAKSICLNFGIAQDYDGLCNLRLDDTNPTKEDVEYVDSIREDVRWLGFNWADREFFASDYYEKLYEYAVELIKKDKAYVDSLNDEQIRKLRGTAIDKNAKIETVAGQESPDRNRPIEESLDLFARMRAGEFEDGQYTLRAKIDMAHPNLNMRDPIIYRIRHAHHHRTGDAWCIYPMYDYAHCVSDSIEGITHSICTLEFENHRPLYDWFLDQLEIYHPQQIEFARLNLTYTVLSKRRLLELVENNLVNGWSDPRMPTVSGFRRRGFTPEAIREFCKRIGVAKTDSCVDIALLEHCLREDLNKRAPRVMGVLHPLKLIITNYPKVEEETLTAINNPEDKSAGSREVPFSRELYIEQADFMEEPPRKFFRLAPGREVRLRYAYFVTCTEVIKNDAGEIVEVHCTYDPATRGGDAPDGRKVKGTIHWVSAQHALDAEVRLYDRLFKEEFPGSDGREWKEDMNPESVEILSGCKLEPSLASADPQTRYQFERLGYFCADSEDSTPDAPVFNRAVALRDSWAKMKKK